MFLNYLKRLINIYSVRPGTLLRWRALKQVLTQEVRRGDSILDLGGGNGFVAGNLKGSIPQLTISVVDLSEKELQVAKEKGLKTICASALDLPIGNDQYDVVICFSVIEHVKEPVKLIREAYRVLKKGGKLILTTPDEHGVSFPFMSKERIDKINYGWGHICKGYSLESLTSMLREAGLHIKSTGKYFNLLSRFVYRLGVLSNNRLRIGFILLYRFILRLEPYIKLGAQANLIVGEK